MKTPNLKNLFTLLIVLVASTVLVNCKAKAPQNTHTIERIIETRNDTISSKEISKAITDSLFIKINEIKSSKPECDSLINLEIQKLLKAVATKKQSGDNQLGFYYDEINNMLVAYGSISENINEKLKIIESLKQKETDKKVEIIQVKYVPKWIKILAIIGALFFVWLGWRFYRIFTP